ncbi:hypothetical protein SAMN02745166_02020 [Prosthecobacter debontii]|uniref:Uncharacterized protein n=1 Tax=Prosthecobacter debontii TaxID=48467 RepID=A0A1T4XTU0_9BACT|nr:hypothetical protein [Prosthecobacter debontii]SKA92989.1 hypothetical protein SAMN02745166_02020 [Prosthecobacter debontii]
MKHHTLEISSTARPQLPWILRVTPEKHRELIQRIGIIVGFICQIVWMLGAFAGLFLGPLLFAIWRPTAPISQPVFWLLRTSGPEWSLIIYTFVMWICIGLVRVGCSFFEYVTATQSYLKDKTQEEAEQNAGDNGS